MATSSSDSIFSLGATQVVVPLGATAAVYVDQISAQNTLILKYFSGGTLEIIGTPDGATLSGASLLALSGTQYIVGATETLNIDGPARFYLSATGATCVVMVLKGRTQGV